MSVSNYRLSFVVLRKFGPCALGYPLLLFFFNSKKLFSRTFKFLLEKLFTKRMFRSTHVDEKTKSNSSVMGIICETKLLPWQV